MGDEVNQAAFEGGDTEAETKAVIHERNKAMQELKEKQDEVGKKLDEAKTEHYENQVEAEKQVADSTQALITGAPVGAPDIDYDSAKGEPTKKTSKKSS